MTLGAERKKVVVLGALLAVAAVIFIINSGDDAASDSQVAAAPAIPAGSTKKLPNEPEPPAARPGRGSTEFRPSMRPKRGEERADPVSIDPTLRLDVLAKLQEVKVEGPRRSIFDFGQAPAPTPDPQTIAASKTPVPSPLVKPVEEPAAGTPAEPAKPQAPPIPLKFYGYISRSNVPSKRAFFMEGEEIHVVAEGELVKKRYKIIRIGVNSVIVEDTQFGQQQTLPLEEQPG